MFIDFLLNVFRKTETNNAVVWRDQALNYQWLLNRTEYWRNKIHSEQVDTGRVVVLEADFSPNAVALFLALIEQGCILVPLTSASDSKRDEFIELTQAEVLFSVDVDDEIQVTRFDRLASHDLYDNLRCKGHPGLVLFSSGSTGQCKAAVHDLVPLLEKFKQPRHSLRTISFLLYDHIGGINTMMYTFSNGGCLVTVQDRSPDSVLATVEKHRVELLPTSPTFLNLVLISEAFRDYDLSSLKTVTYGTEPMPESTLKLFNERFPHIRLLQTYGLSEVGILRSKSRSSDSLWMKIGGEGFDTRVVDGILQIKAQSAMLGYLNAPSPFRDDGWLNTGDRVEVQDEYIRILGRESEIINVGGEKVYPAEVESVIQELENVADAVVVGETNSITGQIVCAKVQLIQPEEPKAFINRLKIYCQSRFQKYKVPVKVEIVAGSQHSSRFKKLHKTA